MLRFEPYFGDLDREIDRFIDRMQRQKRSPVQFGHRAWRPLVDVFETEDMVVAVVELPGVEQAAVDVTVEGRLLTVRGSRPEPAGHRPSSYHQMEISRGAFERAIPLPASVEPERTTAAMRSGMLEVCMPKLKPLQISIEIRGAESGG